MIDVLDTRLMPDFPEALCADPANDPEWWFPLPKQKGSIAKRLCRECPHVEECLIWAIAHDIKDGIWGATGTEARRRMRHRIYYQSKRAKDGHPATCSVSLTAERKGFKSWRERCGDPADDTGLREKHRADKERLS